jgi:multicomponent Na+:H+ antiporter subunit E
MRQKALSFALIFTIWIIFAGRLTKDVIIIGIIAALVTTALYSDMLFRLSNRRTKLTSYIRKSGLILLFIPVFFYEALLAALKVSRHAFERELSFSPGIIKEKTHLTNVSAITILANLITLTPGTLTLDFDTRERVYYIHCLDLRVKEETEAQKKIIGRFEEWLGVIFKR